jgi:hypothetical protein
MGPSGEQRRLEDDQHLIDRDIALWRTIACCALTAVTMLIGSWATHSVTQEQLNTALSNEDKVFSERFDNVRTTLTDIQSDQKHIMEMMDDAKVGGETRPKRVDLR